MKHAGPAALDRLEPLLLRLRTLPGLTERSSGVFYRRGQAFLHFHEDPAGLFADLRVEGDWRRFAVGSEEAWQALLDAAAASLPSSPGRPERREQS